MSGFRNQELNLLFAKQVWEHIKKSLLICSKAMVKDALESSDFVDNHENRIRDRLVAQYLDNDDFRKRMGIDTLKLRFIPEVPENFNQEKDAFDGRTDIRVINQNYFRNGKAYHTIECKCIDGHSTLNKKYVTDGIARFVHPILYPSHYNKNFMLGFIVEDINIDANSKKIEIIQQTELNGYVKDGLLHKIDSNNQYFLYSSEYNISAAESLELHHLFFDFSSIIK